MKTQFFSGSCRTVLEAKAPMYGTTTISESVHPTSLSLSKEKVSVDSGQFVPGVYRVNPYLVFEETCEGKGSDVLTDTASSGAYIYTSTLSGNWQMTVNDTLRSLCPAVRFAENNYPERVLLKAYGKLGNGGVPMGENLGEIRETLKLLRSPFAGFRNFFYDQNHKNLGLLNRLEHFQNTGVWLGKKGVLLGAEAAKVAAGSWLEFRYGLMPLVYTVQDLMELANKQMSELDPLKIRKVRATIKPLETSVSLGTRSLQFGMTTLTLKPVMADKAKYSCSVQYRSNSIPSVMDLLGLTPRYLPETMWDLTRLSFVLDWWFDVGSWIQAYRFKPGITILGNTVGKKVVRTVSAKTESWIGGLNGKKTPRGDTSEFKIEYYERRCNQHLPMLPQFTPEFKSYKHVVDALALTLQPTLGLLQSRKRLK